jgi:hypothetical protein
MNAKYYVLLFQETEENCTLLSIVKIIVVESL